MKRLTLLLLICLLASVNLFAIRLGILQSNWQGWLQGAYYYGLRVEQTAPGYPAFGVIQPGDIITEAPIPNSQIWNNLGIPMADSSCSSIRTSPWRTKSQCLGIRCTDCSTRTPSTKTPSPPLSATRCTDRTSCCGCSVRVGTLGPTRP